MAVPQNVLIDRKVVEDRIKDILETSLDTVQLMTIDNDLVQGAGMVKHINTYENQGAVQAVKEGAGNTVSLPAYNMIGEAVDVAEGEAIPVEALATEMENVTVKKAGKGIRITDEAILSGYGDPLGQASKQLAKAIAAKVDTDVMACFEGIGEEMTISKALSAEVVSEAE